ncbi:HAD-IA family hydrolase [Sinomonas sp. ASV486]|uniref:HAD-IA family hydrolase n=1 Tax=Sinomonas sp. ASV486 TaxID=3051170 RepID=UPI0027DCC777|nr:HAD-IA family hydrolase [Sinomonas sp. ASV486]MDQ4492301.1 HAD-IA family hydrolase [Sinomonas sp. ASV486]
MTLHLRSAHERETRLAVLDMNGTTMTDGGAAERAVERALQERGVQGARLDDALVRSRRSAGLDRSELFATIFAGDVGAAHAASRTFSTAYDAMIADGAIRPIPGAEDTVHVLRDHGLKVCLVTGFGRHTQNSILEALGWMGLADLSLCSEDAGRGRPYPDMILTAVLALDVEDVRDVAVVGDTVADITSGRRAGVGAAFGVLTGANTEDELRAAEADAVVPSIVDVPGLLWPVRTTVLS